MKENGVCLERDVALNRKYYIMVDRRRDEQFVTAHGPKAACLFNTPDKFVGGETR
jgi:hypothetical protein